MVRRLSASNLFCRLHDHFSFYGLVILFHQEKHHLKYEFIQSVRGTHISRAIVLRFLVRIFPLAALFLFSSIMVWYVSHGNAC